MDPSAHSYEACLQNISKADYFILLIGNRVGGWYDETKRVSITQQEYREAYRRHKDYGLRIVTLVRAEVWHVREDRNALAKHLSHIDLSEEQKRKIVNFPSKFAEDADFLSQFLNEVGRNLETTAAVKQGAEKPTANWIYPFYNFNDIEDVLKPLTFTGATAEEASYKKALQYELVELVRRLLLKHKGKALDPRLPIARFWKLNPINPEMRPGTVEVDVQGWSCFSTVMFRLLGAQIEPVVIKDALTSPTLLEYDPRKSSYVPTTAYDLLSQLIDEIGMFNRASSAETFAVIYEFSPASTGRRDGVHHIPAIKLAALVGLSLRWFNLISICEALAMHLDGAPLKKLELMPFSPIRGMQEQIDEENLTSAEARVFLGI